LIRLISAHDWRVDFEDLCKAIASLLYSESRETEKIIIGGGLAENSEKIIIVLLKILKSQLANVITVGNGWGACFF